MKLEDRDKPLFYVGLAIVGLLLVVVFWRQPLFARPWVDPACGEHSLECLFYTWQTFIVGMVAVAATMVAARMAWRAVQGQIDEQRRQKLTDERNQLLRFMSFAEDLAKELTGYRECLTTAERSIREKSGDFEITVMGIKRIPFSMPKYTDAHLSYNTTISLEALNSYILQYEAFIDLDLKNAGLKAIVADERTRERFDTFLYQLERASKRVLDDIVEIDSSISDNRIHQINREVEDS